MRLNRPSIKNKSIKNLIKLVVPPIFLKLFQNKEKEYGFFGDYSSWSEASKDSAGYDSEVILEKVKKSLLKVKRGDAVYERDSVLFDKIQYSWPTLVGLLRAASENQNRLSVLDFGGSLGSSYFQSRAFLSDLDYLKWSIVEQPHYVDCGKQYFEDSELRFYDDFYNCLYKEKPNVLLVSSVLQYLENPYEMINIFVTSKIKWIIVDRTPFWCEDYDKLGIQRIDLRIFDASYPMWVFSLFKFKEILRRAATFEEFESFENGLFGLMWKGFIIKVPER